MCFSSAQLSSRPASATTSGAPTSTTSVAALSVRQRPIKHCGPGVVSRASWLLSSKPTAHAFWLRMDSARLQGPQAEGTAVKCCHSFVS